MGIKFGWQVSNCTPDLRAPDLSWPPVLEEKLDGRRKNTFETTFFVPNFSHSVDLLLNFLNGYIKTDMLSNIFVNFFFFYRNNLIEGSVMSVRLLNNFYFVFCETASFSQKGFTCGWSETNACICIANENVFQTWVLLTLWLTETELRKENKYRFIFDRVNFTKKKKREGKDERKKLFRYGWQLLDSKYQYCCLIRKNLISLRESTASKSPKETNTWQKGSVAFNPTRTPPVNITWHTGGTTSKFLKRSL